jgi:hypothetical protein
LAAAAKAVVAFLMELLGLFLIILALYELGQERDNDQDNGDQ